MAMSFINEENINISISPPREDILKLHILYLEKFGSLSKGERNAYEVYLNCLANPLLVTMVNESVKDKQS